MAGWLKRVDGSGLPSLKTHEKFCKTGSWVDLGPALKAPVNVRKEEQERKDKLKSSFNEFLFSFLKESLGTSSFRTLPPMLGDGKPVDLFNLYLNVRKRGGYKRVSINSSWGSVAKECGFDSSVGLALKLVYFKYLHALSECLHRAVESEDSKSGINDSFQNRFGGCLVDLESNLKGFLSEISDKKKKTAKTEIYTNMGMHNAEIDFICNGKLSNTDEHPCFVKRKAEIMLYDENSESISSRDIKCVNKTRNDNDEYRSVASDLGEKKSIEGGDILTHSVEEDVFSRKRRWESLTGMLKWINRVAKDPCDPAIGHLPERSKWKCYSNDHVWKQVLLVREAMLLKRNVDSSDQQSSAQKKQKMHPFMYDDHTCSERLRFSQRLLLAKDSSKKSCRRSFWMSSSSGSDEDADGQSDSTADSIPDFLANHRRKKRIPLGPQYQADMPEWTGETYESDTKWLGTKLWPLERVEQNKNIIERECIGKGRQDSCGCQFPGSLECVRFHVAEKRRRLRLELGPAFYRWKFDNMGEGVAFSWTKQEEKKFHNTVKSNPFNLGKYFWDELVKSFPGKSRQLLVSYYFNVFLLQQRAQQNRTTPDELNSDEEDSEFGAESANPGSIFCSPKKTNPGFR